MRGVAALGVTGMIGAGKTTFARALEALGGRPVDADDLARAAVAPGTPAHAALVEAFGPTIVAADGTIDRPALAALAFASEATWRRVNAIVHPVVIEAARARMAADPGARWILDVPLLYESGMDALCDAVAVVAAPRDVRYARLAARGLAPDEAARREAFLMPEEEKRRRAAFVVENAGTPEALRRAAEEVWKRWSRSNR